MEMVHGKHRCGSHCGSYTKLNPYVYATWFGWFLLLHSISLEYFFCRGFIKGKHQQTIGWFRICWWFVRVQWFFWCVCVCIVRHACYGSHLSNIKTDEIDRFCVLKVATLLCLVWKINLTQCACVCVFCFREGFKSISRSDLGFFSSPPSVSFPICPLNFSLVHVCCFHLFDFFIFSPQTRLIEKVDFSCEKNQKGKHGESECENEWESERTFCWNIHIEKHFPHLFRVVADFFHE